MDPNWHPRSRPATAPRVDLDERSGGPTLRNPNAPSTLFYVDTTRNTEGTTYGTTPPTGGGGMATAPSTATIYWNNQENNPFRFLAGVPTLANQYSALDIHSSGGPHAGNFANQSIVGNVGYPPPNGRIFDQNISSSETILGEDPNDYVAQYSYASFTAHARNSASNSETNSMPFPNSRNDSSYSGWNGQAYSDALMAGSRSRPGTSTTTPLPRDPTTPLELWHAEKPGHDPPHWHHVREGIGYASSPPFIAVQAAAAEAVHPDVSRRPANPKSQQLSSVPLTQSDAGRARMRLRNGRSSQLTMPSIAQVLYGGEPMSFNNIQHSNSNMIPVFPPQDLPEESYIPITGHGSPQNIVAVQVPSRQLQQHFLEFLMANRPALNSVTLSDPNTIVRVQHKFQHHLQREGLVYPLAEIQQMFVNFRPTVGSDAGRRDRDNRMTKMPKFRCPFSLSCESRFTRLGGVKNHLSAHFKLTPRECLHCGKTLPASSIKRHEDNCQGSNRNP